MEFHRVNPEYDSNLEFLYDLLLERKPEESISHKEMPTYEEHVLFVESNPYKAWYIVTEHSIPVGSCYISHNNEIGVAILKKYRKNGYGTKILEHVLKSNPNQTFLANINPNNEKSIRLFEKMGFKHIQNTYST